MRPAISTQSWGREDRASHHRPRAFSESPLRLSDLPHPSRGLAVLPGPTRESTRIFLCDPVKHQIRILNGGGLVVGAFGGSHGPAGLAWPADVLLVRPEFSGERYDADGLSGAWLVVADRVRQRLQVYETDGTFVGCVGDGVGRAGDRAAEAGERPGWPFFGLAEVPRIGAPVGLTWRAPYLAVTNAAGDLVEIDLAYALLPNFETWLASAGCGELFSARRYFRHRVRSRVLGTERLLALDSALGTRLLEARQFAQAGAVWENELPRGTVDRGVLRRVVQDRLASVTRCAFRIGRYRPVASVAALLRGQLVELGPIPTAAPSFLAAATPQRVQHLRG